MKNYKNLEHPGNSVKFRTKALCITPNCPNLGGTAWSPLWCVKCNIKRMDRIDKGLNDILRGFK